MAQNTANILSDKAYSEETELVQIHEPGAHQPFGKERHIVVVGAGPVGVYFCNELLMRNPSANITLIGNEPYAPYNRVQLTGVLAKTISRENIDIDLPSSSRFPGFYYEVINIDSINREDKLIIDSLGNEYKYDDLVLAVGSYPFVPNIPGNSLTGVYTFRNLKDTDALYARLARARHAVVVGGGVLGIEAAKALSNHNTKVTIVQQGDRLMNRQLDERSAELLADAVAAHNISIRLNCRLSAINGEARVESVVLKASSSRDLEQLECDTVLFSTGVKPNTNLAAKARLGFGIGVKINDQLRTSDPNIFAIGECAEYNGETWGLVAPGYEQAAILADRFVGGKALYKGSTSLARLKVIEHNVCSVGDIDHRPKEPNRSELIFYSKEEQLYRKLVLKNGRLIGAIGFGNWNEIPRIQEALTTQRRIGLLRRLWFLRTGQLWPNDSEDNIRLWPANATVCQCNNVSVDTILKAVDAGANTVAEIKGTTQAGTGCGSCQYLLTSVTGDAAQPKKERQSLWLLLGAVLAITLGLFQFLSPGLEVADSVQTVSAFEKIWNDKFYKQVTGFSLLAITVLATLLSLRKRISKVRWGDYPIWRTLHVILGVIGIALVLVHTGFHTGSNLNRYLAYDFIAVIVLGACTSLVIAQSHHLSFSNGKRLRDFWFWTHVLVTWPLPVLIVMHIVSVYYF